MDSPFVFGKVVFKKSFINRKDDIKHLSDNVRSGVNTILISPRRWGKSSLVRRVAHEFEKDKNHQFCFIDLFNIRKEEEFYGYLVREVIGSTSSKVEEWLKIAREFLKKLSPKVAIGVDGINDVDLQLDFKENKLGILEALNLAEKVAIDKKIRVIICIDEFQNIEKFDDPLGFQQRLRAQWQHHRHVVYCLYGSKRHMLMQLFQKRSMPFYKFGDVFYLDKIGPTHFATFIRQSFGKGGKQISKELAMRLVEEMQCHSYYVQQLSHILWNTCDREVGEKDYAKAVDRLIETNLYLFQREIEHLSNAQLKFLKMLIDGVPDQKYTTNERVSHYELGSSSNVVYVMEALEKKEIIDRFGETVGFIDPVFALWLKKVL